MSEIAFPVGMPACPGSVGRRRLLAESAWRHGRTDKDAHRGQQATEAQIVSLVHQRSLEGLPCGIPFGTEGQRTSVASLVVGLPLPEDGEAGRTVLILGAE